MSRSARLLAGVALVLAAVVGPPAPAAAEPPVPGGSRALFGGTKQLLADEAAMGRSLDVVRVYTRWDTGPVLPTSTFAPMTDGGRRTLLVSTTIPWDAWKSEAQKRNGDANPGNNVPTPWCKFAPVRPGTSTPSGKTWWGAVADGDYDAALRTWLTGVHDLAGTAPEVYATLQHEMDRLGKDAGTRAYQRCLGGPADYRAAFARLRQVAQGAFGGTDLTATPTGRIKLVPIFTGWGFSHTADGDRPLVNTATGATLPGLTGDDATLKSARVTEWLPALRDDEWVGADVFNLSGSTAGMARPVGIKVDDPATAKKETDQWRELEVLLRPIERWTDAWAATSGGGQRQLYLAEYGSVPDPTRSARRAEWLTRACTYLSSPPARRFVAASYFDVNVVQLGRWNWTRTTDGRWSATGSSSGVDTTSVAALGAAGRSARFGGAGPCTG